MGIASPALNKIVFCRRAPNHVCQDVAVVPFLWVAPLALYLLSFIICFDHERWYVRPLWAALVAVGVPSDDAAVVARGDAGGDRTPVCT